MLPPSKFGQCLEIDDRRSKLKFCDVTWPSLYFKDSSVFYRLVFFRLFCKIIDLLDTNLNFLGSIFDVNIDNCANCCEVNVRRSYISRNELFKLFSLFRPIIYRPDELFNFEPYNILTNLNYKSDHPCWNHVPVKKSTDYHVNIQSYETFKFEQCYKK